MTSTNFMQQILRFYKLKKPPPTSLKREAPSNLPPLGEASNPSKEYFSNKSKASPNGGRLEGASLFFCGGEVGGGFLFLLFQYAQLLTYLYEGIDATVELFTVMSGTDLHTDTCLVFRNNRIIEACDIDAFFLHFCCIHL